MNDATWVAIFTPAVYMAGMFYLGSVIYSVHGHRTSALVSGFCYVALLLVQVVFSR